MDGIRTAAIVIAYSTLVSSAAAGPFVNLGIAATDPALVAWADAVVNSSPTPSGSSTGLATRALGAANGSLASLGDLTAAQMTANLPAGRITLSFNTALRNGPGWDLAVFENAGQFFAAPFVFGELAYLEVSSNGVDFARFPSTSLNVEPGTGTADTELVVSFGRNFAGLNPTNVRNLAGIHPQGVGTAFDLADLIADPLVIASAVNLDSVRFVRLVDVPGDGSSLDAGGRPILDAWVTTGTTGGLDLDAVGARYLVPEPGSALLMTLGLIGVLCRCAGRLRRVRWPGPRR